MNKQDVIGEAIATIPGWLAFLDVKEAEQQAILAEIAQHETQTGAVGGRGEAAPPNGGQTAVNSLPDLDGETAVSPIPAFLDDDERLPFDDPAETDDEPALDELPLAWLAEDAPPPAGEPQQPSVTALTDNADTELPPPAAETPPWAEA